MKRVESLPDIPQRPSDGHKGTFGRVLISAGSRGMSGAAVLCGLGALRGGAGLVFVAVPESIVSIVAGAEPSYLNIPLPEDREGRLCVTAADRLLHEAETADVIAIGSGWGRSPDLDRLAHRLYEEVSAPLVVDADALNALAASGELPAPAGPRIITPHPGEFSRLIGRDLKDISGQREELASRFAEEHGIVVVLKGAGTVITDGEQIAVNTTGNSGMATGGSGDVLTGLTAAVLAQGLPPFGAARLAAHLHGLACDLAAEELSEPGLIASDLPRFLPFAWKSLQAEIDRDNSPRMGFKP